MADFASSSAAQTEIILVSGDNEEYRVPLAVAEMSQLVKTMVSEEQDEEERRVPLPNVKKEILSKVLEYCTHHAEEPMVEFVKVN